MVRGSYRVHMHHCWATAGPPLGSCCAVLGGCCVTGGPLLGHCRAATVLLRVLCWPCWPCWTAARAVCCAITVPGLRSGFPGVSITFLRTAGPTEEDSRRPSQVTQLMSRPSSAASPLMTCLPAAAALSPVTDASFLRHVRAGFLSALPHRTAPHRTAAASLVQHRIRSIAAHY